MSPSALHSLDPTQSIVSGFGTAVQADIDKMEHRVTKVTSGLEHSPCEERTRNLRMFSPPKGRLWGELVESTQ